LKNVANPKLRISTLSTDNGIKIFIEDNGCGIPEELKSKIFEPFVTSKEKGTGLGLAICREIIKSYSGEINLNLNKKRGVEFSIFLPE
jgi:C4-dicarboxylate-specific signal transduction histidine kinase